ncbi:MAG: hypothetical protein HXN82_06795 [Prevotella pallens]|nr:hypothetical protein [Prevotella pallens]
MKQITKFLMALTLVAVPVGFTSCDNEEEYHYYYNDLVTEAVRNYWYTYPSGADYYTTRDWFLYHYPSATAIELAKFMEAVNYGYIDNYNPKENDPLMAEVQMLTGEWAGDMTIYFDEKGKRMSQTFHANMKFFQYESSKNSLSGHGTEVDTAGNGATQTLDFSWFVDKNGDIYIKYTKSGTIFRMDAKSSKKGFHLGYEKAKGYDTFYGYGISTNTTDEFVIDLARQATSNGKGRMVKSRTATGKIAGEVFGKAILNDAAEHKAKAVSGLRER